MELVLVDKSNYKKAIEIQNKIFPKEDGTINILASLDRDLFMKVTGLYYEDDHIKFYLAKDNNNNNYLGITGIYSYDDNDAWLAWFGILEEYQNKGFGRELLRETMEKAKSLNYKNFRLYTDPVDNYKATKLYEKEGFIKEEYTKEQLPFKCLLYSKSLTGDKVDLWNNKDLGLSYQTELDHMDDNKINEIYKKYEEMKWE